MTSTDISVGELGALCVVNENNDIVGLSDLWKKTQTVLVFVRHFG